MMSDGAHLTSFGIEFQTKEEAKENERSPSVALQCAGLIFIFDLFYYYYFFRFDFKCMVILDDIGRRKITRAA